MLVHVFCALALGVAGERLVEKDFYERFGLPRSCTEKQLKKAFKKLALQYHPDKNPDDEEAAENFVAINRAYEILSDPEKRQVYDRFGEEGLAQKDQMEQQQRDFGFKRYEDMGLYEDDPFVEELNWATWQSTASSTACWWVNFFSDGCSHCRDLAPDYSRLAERLSGICRVAVVNCGENMQMCMQLGIQAYPSVWLYPASPTSKSRQQRAPRITSNQRDFDSLLAFFQKYTSSQNVKSLSATGLLGTGSFAAGVTEDAGHEWLVGFCFDSEVCNEVQMTLNELWIGVHPVLYAGKFDCLTDSQRQVCEEAGIEQQTDMMDLLQGEFYYFNTQKGGKPVAVRLKGKKVRELISSALAASTPMPKIEPSLLQSVSPILKPLATRQRNVGKDKEASQQAHIVVFFPNVVPKLDREEDLSSLEDTIMGDTKLVLALKTLRHTHPQTWVVECSNDMPHFTGLDSVKELCLNAQRNNQPVLALIQPDRNPTLYAGSLSDPAEMSQFLQDFKQSKVKTLSPNYVQAYINTGAEAWLVDFFAPWCGHCVTLAPIWRDAAEQLADRYPHLQWGTVDCVQYPGICQAMGIQSYPTVILFENSRAWGDLTAPLRPPLVQRFQSGSHTVADFEDFIEEAREPSVVSLTAANFHELVVQSDETWLVDWYTEWCGPCLQMIPEYTKAAKLLKGLVRFGKVECDQNPTLRDQFAYQIPHYPTIMGFKAGKKNPSIFNNNWRTKATFVDFALKQLPADRRVTELTPVNFDQLVTSSKNPWIIDYMSPRCGPCVAMKPLFQTFAANVTAKPKNRLKFGLVNCMSYYNFCNQENIHAYPTFRYVSKVRGISKDLQNVADASSLRKAVAAQYRQDQKLALEKKKADGMGDDKPTHDEL